MVLVVTSIASQEVLERWAFDIQTSRAPAGDGRARPSTARTTLGVPARGGASVALAVRRAPTLRVAAAARPPPEKPESEITSEIQAIIRQARPAGPARCGRSRHARGSAPTARSAAPEAPAARAQITASVTFLPLLQDACTFDLLVYADSDSPVPVEWCARPGRAPPGSGAPRPRGAWSASMRACGLTAHFLSCQLETPCLRY